MTVNALNAELAELTRLMATASPAELEKRTRGLLAKVPDDPRLLRGDAPHRGGRSTGLRGPFAVAW